MSDDLDMDDGDTAKVFLSYSRKDRESAEAIARALRARRFGVYRDTDDILPTEEWRERLKQLIEDADTIVFLLSPNSVASEVCAWEVEYAASLNKRIAPIVIEDVEGTAIPPLLARLNFIFCTPRDDFETALDTLGLAIGTDIDWIREHTRLLGLARRWDRAGRPNHLLVRGQENSNVEAWRDNKPQGSPEITELQSAFIGKSRLAASRRQRWLISGSVFAAIFATTLSIVAFLAQQRADEQARIAEEQRDLAEAQRDLMLKTQSRFLADLASQANEANRPATAVLLALEALPDLAQDPGGEPQSLRPTVAQALTEIRAGLRMLPRSHAFHGDWGYVRSVTFSPDDSRFMATFDNLARIWDVQAKSELMTLSKPNAGPTVTAAIFSPDARYALTDGYSTGMAHLWDLSSAQSIGEYTSNQSPVGEVTFRPDGTQFATTGKDTVFVWDTATGDLVHELKIKESGGPITVAAFSPDGTQLLTAYDEEPVLWNVETGEQVQVLTGHQKWVPAARFSASGRYIVTASGDNTARLWDTATGDSLAEFAGHTDYLVDATVHPDESLIATASEDTTARIWDAETGQTQHVLDGHVAPLTTLEFSPDGALLVTASEDGRAMVWSSASGDLLAVLDGHTGTMADVAFTSDAATLATGAFDTSARLWDMTKLTQRSLIPPGLRSVDEFVNQERRYSIAKDDDGALSIVNLASGEVIKRPDLAGGVWRADVSRDGQRAVLAFLSGELVIIEVETGKTLQTLDGHSMMITSADFSSDGRFVATSSYDKTARVWDTHSGKEVRRLDVGHVVERVRFGPEDRFIAVHSPTRLNKESAMWDFENNRRVASIESYYGAEDMHIARGGKFALVKPEADSAEIFDLTTGELHFAVGFDQPPSYLRVNNARLSPDGTLLVTGIADGTARVWDVATGEERHVLTGHEDRIVSVEFSFSGEMIVTASQDGTARVWDTASGDVLAAFQNHSDNLVRARFSDDDQSVITLSRDIRGSPAQSLRIWPLYSTDVGDLVQLAKRSVSKCLSLSERSAAFLPPEPPRWCITGPGLEAQDTPEEWMPLSPYHTDAWKAWLVAKDAGEEPAMPVSSR